MVSADDSFFFFFTFFGLFHERIVYYCPTVIAVSDASLLVMAVRTLAENDETSTCFKRFSILFVCLSFIPSTFWFLALPDVLLLQYRQ